MSDKDMNKREETDWERIDAMSDDRIIIFSLLSIMEITKISNEGQVMIPEPEAKVSWLGSGTGTDSN